MKQRAVFAAPAQLNGPDKVGAANSEFKSGLENRSVVPAEVLAARVELFVTGRRTG